MRRRGPMMALKNSRDHPALKNLSGSVLFRGGLQPGYTMTCIGGWGTRSGG